MRVGITKSVIFEYLEGRTTTFQKQEIETWYKDPANKELFFSWLWEWEQRNSQYPADIEAGLERHWDKMRTGKKEAARPVPSGRRRYRWIAAAIVLLTAAGGWYFKEAILFRTYATAYGEIRELTLPDASKVVLNANSAVRVPRFGFGDQTREVYLEGEAVFEVKRTPHKSNFVVNTAEGVHVVVLGTVFNVYSRPRATRVLLNEGKIQLHYSEGSVSKEITMLPGDLATLGREGRLNLRKVETPDNFSAWKLHRFVFENTTLLEICQQLEDNFGVRVIINNPELGNLTLTGSFTALDAAELLELLCQAAGLHYDKRDNKTIVLDNEP